MNNRSDSPATYLQRGVTLWRRIADEFERAIALGTYRAGDKLPAESDVAQRFGVNRHTVRRALAALAERGLVRAERGSGTFVEEARLAYPIGPRTRFSEIVATAGLEADGRLVDHKVFPAPPAIAARLDLTAGAPVTKLEILRSAGRQPLCRAASFVSAERLPKIAAIYRATRSMTRTLAHFGVHDYRRRDTRINAALADAHDAEHLALAPGRPILAVESIDVDAGDRPIVATEARFAADRVSLLVRG